MKTKFGKPMRKHFLFQNSWLNMNHGSFGAIPRCIRKCLHEKQDLVESSPDSFIRFDYAKHLLESRTAIATLVKAPVQSIALVPNATTGIDTILRNLEYSRGDYILTFSTVYGAAERTALHLSEVTGVQIANIPITYPMSDADILLLFLATVQNIGADQIKVAVFDTISFEPGVRMPFEALVQACRERNILSCVDGAHCIGQIPINLESLDPDFFVSNLHKWLFVPRGCAVLYVPPRNQALIRTTFPTSWGFTPRSTICRCQFQQSSDQSAFERLFESVGTMDYSPFLCVAEALRFRKQIGGENAIMLYNSQLAREGGRIMAQILGTDVLDNAESTLTRGLSMVNVQLPLHLKRLPGKETVDWICRTLVSEYHTFTPVFIHGHKIWTRVSAQVYLELDDFVFLGHIFKDICDRVKGGVVGGNSDTKSLMLGKTTGLC
ncbi:pyridoxal phosphate-dependent transferase [Aspergillus pseudotamarii]|uniref:Pyridoxal phosphate-dependent transferase n=1 Tax=Aspergillus pseudotamarii TaxID=132259 RepID=A0A5N6SRY3_ASPPS|nr:pyridoxal phosphate-dependent transferase [Aspergillus pseudotamarii]KAE8137458.1 pyridoxal phosphate-dependent transferase [Aspergillus pseudotamarii]